MKWKLELVSTLTLVTQMTALFLFWWFGLLATDQGTVNGAILVAFIGSVGAATIWLLRKKEHEESDNKEELVRWTGAIVTSIGAVIVFVPLYSILTHSTIAAVILAVGVLAPVWSARTNLFNGAN